MILFMLRLSSVSKHERENTKFTWKHDLLRCNGKSVIPNSSQLWEQLLYEFHESYLCGHASTGSHIFRQLNSFIITRNAYSCHQYVKCCLTYQQVTPTQEDYCSSWHCYNKYGKTFGWTSYQVYLIQKDIQLSMQSSTIFPNMGIKFPSKQTLLPQL